jgi:hypothetical protein
MPDAPSRRASGSASSGRAVPRSRTAAAIVLAAAMAVIAWQNCRTILGHPDLGLQYVLIRRAQLITEIEGVRSFSKQEIINLDRGDGMRFASFAAHCIPQNAVLTFPVEQLDQALRGEVLGSVNEFQLSVALYPRALRFEKYDFRLNASAAASPDQPQAQIARRDYSHSSRHFVFSAAILPACTSYRLRVSTAPVLGNSQYHTETRYLLEPDCK